MQDLPNRLRELRVAAELSQEDLADLIGCSKMQISGLERGRPKLDIDWMRRLAPALGVSPADLLSDADNPFRLNQEEQELVTRYRQADDDRREDLSRVAEVLLPFRTRNAA